MGRYDLENNERSRFRKRGKERQSGSKKSVGGTKILLASSLALIGTFGLVFSQSSHDGSEAASQTVGADPDQPQMALCGSGPRTNCVVDGDTIWLRGAKIRIADIDTPEVSQPQCDFEYELGMQSTRRLRVLLNEGPWSVDLIGHRETDQYGRQLRVLTRNGRSIGDMLVAEGLARTWGGRREPWC